MTQHKLVIEYRLPGGSLRVHRKGDVRGSVFIPTWCPHISKKLSREDAARGLWEHRRAVTSIHREMSL